MPALIYSQSEVDLEVLVLARKEKKKKNRNTQSLLVDQLIICIKCPKANINF